VVKKGAKVQYAIVGERACIGAEAQVGASPETVADPAQWGVTVLGPDSRVAAGEVVAAKTMIDRTHGEG